MKEISWGDFYERFYDWAESTQKSRAYGLADYGPADEVFEVAMEFAFRDKKVASRFVDRALEAGVHFTPDQVLEAVYSVDDETLGRMAETAVPALSREQAEDLYWSIDRAVFARIAKRLGIAVSADGAAPEYSDPPKEKPPKIGFFTRLMAAVAAADAVNGLSAGSGHGGRCNGDCAHCPPHYGYRYGRWYYGRGHQYGCEFGGNKGDGSLW